LLVTQKFHHAVTVTLYSCRGLLQHWFRPVQSNHRILSAPRIL